MYALSTCWNSHRHTDGRAMLQEIRSLGFEHVELSHGIRISLLPGIFEAVDAGLVRITSVHNFCPLPLGVERAAPNIFKFSSEDPRERDHAFRQSLKTFDTAARVGARTVVLHLGSIEMRDYTDRLIELIENGKRNTPKYEQLLGEVQELRERKKEKFVLAAHDMLRRLIPEAEKRGVVLGVENREAVAEIPLECDLQFFFREFDSPTVGYWHDTGHAQIKENLGLIYHQLHLESHASRLLGLHVHDVSGPGRDHFPPGRGNVDFRALAPFVKPAHVKVLEIGPGATAPDVKAGWVHLKSIWGSE